MKLWLTYHSIGILGGGGFGQIYSVEEKQEKTDEKIEEKIEDKSSPEIVIKIVLRDKTTESSAVAERKVLEAFSNHKRSVKNIVWDSTFLLRS